MKKIFWAFLIVIAVSVIFYFLSQENYSSYTFPIKESRDIVVKAINQIFGTQKLNEVLSKTEQSAAEKISEKSEGLLTKVSEKTESVFESIKSKAFELFKGAANEKMNQIGENIGIKVDGGEGLEKEISPVFFTVKTGTPVYFTIDNKEKVELSYEVDWQDGNKDLGKLKSGDRIRLMHIWGKIGDYIVEFKIVAPKGEIIYPVSISIF